MKYTNNITKDKKKIMLARGLKKISRHENKWPGNLYEVSKSIERLTLRGTKRALIYRKCKWLAKTYDIYYRRYEAQESLFSFFLPECKVIKPKRKPFWALSHEDKIELKKKFTQALLGFYENLKSVMFLKRRFFTIKKPIPQEKRHYLSMFFPHYYREYDDAEYQKYMNTITVQKASNFVKGR